MQKSINLRQLEFDCPRITLFSSVALYNVGDLQLGNDAKCQNHFLIFFKL